MNKKIAALVVISLLFLTGCYPKATPTQTTETTEKESRLMDKEMDIKDEVIKTPRKIVSSTDSSFQGEILAGNEALVFDFNKADYDKALSSKKLIVLYFYANWCPICAAEIPKMYEAFDGLTSDEVVGFRVNFNDNETDDDEVSLAREFGVAYQHTKVFLLDGERVLKAPDSWEKDRYLEEINKYINQ